MSWKRILAVGCSHGEFIDTDAAKAIIRFKDAWKPHTRVHLGDAFDFSCLRSGARRDPEDPDNDQLPDLEPGFRFLEAFDTTHYIWGNHEDRVNGFADHWNARMATLGTYIRNDILSFCRRRRMIVKSTWDNRTWFQFGNYKWGHGTLFGVNYLKDSARAFGNCVVVHAHHPGIATAERDDGARALSPGCLRTFDSAGYAKSRKATLGWGLGFVWGEYNDDEAVLWLHSQPTGQKEWRLPV